MKQPGTPVQADPINPAATQPTLDHGARTTTTRSKAKRLPQPAQNPHLVINVHGATFDLPTPDADVLD